MTKKSKYKDSSVSEVSISEVPGLVRLKNYTK